MARCIDESQLSQIQDVVLFVQKLIEIPPQTNANNKSTCDKFIALRLQCTDFICNISYILGKFGNQAANEVKLFTTFALQGFPDAKLTLSSSATCFVQLCSDCSDVLAPFTE